MRVGAPEASIASVGKRMFAFLIRPLAPERRIPDHSLDGRFVGHDVTKTEGHAWIPTPLSRMLVKVLSPAEPASSDPPVKVMPPPATLTTSLPFTVRVLPRISRAPLPETFPTMYPRLCGAALSGDRLSFVGVFHATFEVTLPLRTRASRPFCWPRLLLIPLVAEAEPAGSASRSAAVTLFR